MLKYSWYERIIGIIELYSLIITQTLDTQFCSHMLVHSKQLKQEHCTRNVIHVIHVIILWVLIFEHSASKKTRMKALITSLKLLWMKAYITQ